LVLDRGVRRHRPALVPLALLQRAWPAGDALIERRRDSTREGAQGSLEDWRRASRGCPEGNVRTAEEVKAAILETRANADCSMTGVEEKGGGERVEIRAGKYAVDAL